MKKTLLTLSTIVSSCFFVSAQVSISTGAPLFNTIVRLVGVIQKILDRAVPLLLSLAVLGLFWFMLLFVWKGADNPDERTKAKVGVAWSLGAIFMMVAIWGIIAFIATTLGVSLGGEMENFRIPGT
jgi:hypothetical protein